MTQDAPLLCAHQGCEAAGEFRAPLSNRGGERGREKAWKYFCLDHVREFNAAYSYEGDVAAMHPDPRWERTASAFASNAYADVFCDPAGIMAGRFGAGVFNAPPARGGEILGAADMAALKTLDLDENARWEDIRLRYKERIRALHPDTNGGDRTHEAKLRRVIDAYTQLRESPAFGQTK